MRKRLVDTINTAASTLLSIAFLVGALTLVSVTSVAADSKSDAQSAVSSIGGGSGSDTTELPAKIKSIITILLFVVGVAAVIMIIIGGIRYTTSNGDSSQTTAAKNTVLYAVVGLVIAVMAFAIVNWVIGKV